LVPIFYQKEARGCIADLLLAYKPVAITVHVAILALQACLVSHQAFNPLPGKTNNFNKTKKFGKIGKNKKLKNFVAGKTPTLMNKSAGT